MKRMQHEHSKLSDSIVNFMKRNKTASIADRQAYASTTMDQIVQHCINSSTKILEYAEELRQSRISSAETQAVRADFRVRVLYIIQH